MITALGIGTKQAPDNVNLDPQKQFWSWLYSFKAPQSEQGTTPWRNGYFAGFSITQTDPVGMSVQIGGTDPVDSALLEYEAGKMTLLSTDGTPQVVTIPTAPTSGSRIDSIVSYIDTTSADPEAETPGTPEYIKTVVVSGTVASSPTAPTKQNIQAALPPTVSNWYHWADVRVAQGTTTITNSNITDRKPTPPNVYFTTSSITAIADSRINAKAPYVASVRKTGTSPSGGPYRINAPAARSGYKFLCWVNIATEGYVAAWNTDNPDNPNPQLYCAADRGGSGTIVAQALYVPTS